MGVRISGQRSARVTCAVVLAVGALGPAAACGSTPSTQSTAGAGAATHQSEVRLTVLYRPHGAYPLPGQANPALRWTLSCSPPRGSHPARVAACRELAQHGSDLYRPLVRCLVIVRGAPSALVTGVVGGRQIVFAASACSPAWHTLHALLTGLS